jgi:ribosomal protein L11 methyltransferase
MPWLKITAHLTAPAEDDSHWPELFSRYGIEGTVEEEVPPTISGFCDSADADLVPGLTETLLGAGAVNVTTEEIEEIDWSEAWKQFFHPQRVGNRFVICPTWEESPAGPDDWLIWLDPGEAFGTGDHATTRLCLQLLEQTKPDVVADIGCGTGILAIGACKMGASDVWAVDVETPAVASARANAALNKVSFEVFQGMGFDPLPEDQRYDVVLSNILSVAVIGLAPEVSQRLLPGGQWIISGIVNQNWPDVESALSRNGFTVAEKLGEGEWVAARCHL